MKIRGAALGRVLAIALVKVGRERWSSPREVKLVDRADVFGGKVEIGLGLIDLYSAQENAVSACLFLFFSLIIGNG